MKFKRLLASALSACMITVGGAAQALSAQAIVPVLPMVSLSHVTTAPGGIVEFPIGISELEFSQGTEFVGISFSYDPRLKLITDRHGSTNARYDEGTTGMENYSFVVNEQSGRVSFQGSNTDNYLEDGLLATLYFLVPENVPEDTYRININDVVLRGDGDVNYNVGWEGGSVEVVTSLGFSDTRIIADKVSADPGEQVEFTVKLNKNPGHKGYGAKLDYDPALEIVPRGYDSGMISYGPATGEADNIFSLNKEDGILTLFSSFTGEGGVADQAGELFSVKFNIPENADPGYYPVFISGAYTSSANIEKNYNPVHGWIHVKGDEPQVVFSADKIEASPGETVAYTIYTSENAGYDQVAVNYSFEPTFTVRKESGIANGAYTKSGPAALTSSNIASLNQSKGTISFADAGKSKTSTGALFTVYMTIPEDAEEGVYAVKLGNCTAKSGGNELRTASENGFINVVKKIKGDVNNDKSVNMADAVLLQKWLLAVPGCEIPIWKNADLCDDGKLNVFDLCLLKQYVAELSAE
ncbi:MAG: hypothetical protein II762_09905 [Ruminococcus sp.]|nr:hypothetical protein [Ruminococcus sp.]